MSSPRQYQVAYCCDRRISRWTYSRGNFAKYQTHCHNCGAPLSYQDRPDDYQNSRQIVIEILRDIPEPFDTYDILRAFSPAKYRYTLSYNSANNIMRMLASKGILTAETTGTKNKPGTYRRGPEFRSASIHPIRARSVRPTYEPLKLSPIAQEWREFRAKIVIPDDPMDLLWSRVYNNN